MTVLTLVDLHASSLHPRESVLHDDDHDFVIRLFTFPLPDERATGTGLERRKLALQWAVVTFSVTEMAKQIS